jgi:serine/threonine protein kinase
MIGKTLGHYQITSQLGKGGMGEVYQAKDGKLGRDVAIKVLPEEFAKDADRVARLQRGAKLPASTNGASEPEGSNDGRELFYRSGGTMMAVAVQTEPTFKPGAPKMRFRDIGYSLQDRQWDLDHDSKRCLMIKPSQPASDASAAAKNQHRAKLD